MYVVLLTVKGVRTGLWGGFQSEEIAQQFIRDFQETSDRWDRNHGVPPQEGAEFVVIEVQSPASVFEWEGICG